MKQVCVLIVDDDSALLQALPQALALRLKDVQVDTCDSAFSAIECIRANDYDAIISDIKMPGMDGLALLAKVRELRPDIPTLLITGHGDHELAIKALRGGAYDFIQKPIDRDYFVAALRRAIQTHQLRVQVQEQQRALEQYNRSLEQAVQERTRELIAANAVKDEFISMASHELKTPLSSLKGMTQLLHRRLQRMGSKEVANLANMENAIRRMEMLVNDLLSTSFIDMGKLALTKQNCDLGELCRGLVEEFIMGTNPSPDVEVDVPAEPVMIELDSNRIGQVVMNLLSNARKYSPPASLITVSLTKSADSCVIAVRDNGVGIAPERLPHIFDRFYRVPNIEVLRGSSVGLGLGLYISKQIVERHGGHIEVASEEGKGSVFSIFLPCVVNVTEYALRAQPTYLADGDAS